MEFFIKIFLFLNLLYYSLGIVPNWNIQSVVIDLRPSFTDNKLTYATISLSGHDLGGILRKELTINDNKINKANYLSINGESEFKVSFEDIESVYFIANSRVICPKGKYHPYKISGTVFSELNPSSNGFEEKGNWNLRCYFHGAGLEGGGSTLDSPGAGFFMLFYLMNGRKASYNTDFNKDASNFKWEASKSNDGAIDDELYDFKLQYGTKAFEKSNNNFIEYQMNGLVSENNNLKLKSYKVKFESKYDKRDGIQIYGEGSSITLTTSKKYNQAYINEGDTLNYFYFFSYNDISDFTCGYSTKGFSSSNYFNLNEVTFNIFSDLPFEFVDEVEIKEMKIISNYRYVYYSIYNKQTTKTYHGLFDIKTNKILFNTNEDLDTFLPYQVIQF